MSTWSASRNGARARSSTTFSRSPRSSSRRAEGQAIDRSGDFHSKIEFALWRSRDCNWLQSKGVRGSRRGARERGETPDVSTKGDTRLGFLHQQASGHGTFAFARVFARGESTSPDATGTWTSQHTGRSNVSQSRSKTTRRAFLRSAAAGAVGALAADAGFPRPALAA